MADNLELLSRARENQIRAAAESREQQAEQEKWGALADAYEQEIRNAADAIGRKKIAADTGYDLSTISNQLACAVGRGWPSPMLMLYLREKHLPLAAWEAEHADYLPPQRKESAIDESQALNELERDLLPDLGKRQADHFRSVIKRLKKGGLR